MLSLRGGGEEGGRGSKIRVCLKETVVTSGLCWLKTFLKERTGNKPAEKPAEEWGADVISRISCHTAAFVSW